MRSMRAKWTALASLVVLLGCGSDSTGPPVISTLQNDNFTSGGTPGFQGGFQTGEAAAVRLGPRNAGFTLNKVEFLFGGGGDTTTKTITLTVYSDSGGDNPGAVLHSADYVRKASDQAMQEIDVTSLNLHVAAHQTIRVAIGFQHTGFPSVAIDGARTADRNLMNLNIGGWTAGETVGLSGDFIIRAEIATP